MRCASRSPASRSRRSCRGAHASRSWSNRRSCRCREPNRIRGKPPSPRLSTSSSGSVSRPATRRCSSPEAWPGARVASSWRRSSRRSSRGASTAMSRCTTSSGKTWSRSARRTRFRSEFTRRSCTDAVVVVSAAETVLHGGPAALVGAASREVLRAAGAYSLLETSASQGWRLGLELERELARRVPMIGASLVLNHPRFGGTLGGYPYEEQALERVVRSPFRQLFRTLPEAARAYVLRSVPLERTIAAAFAGPPSVAHTEALLRGVELRGITLDHQLDAIC